MVGSKVKAMWSDWLWVCIFFQLVEFHQGGSANNEATLASFNKKRYLKKKAIWACNKQICCRLHDKYIRLWQLKFGHGIPCHNSPTLTQDKFN